MSHRARYRSAVGTIVDGKVRDLQEHRDLGYPVFARGVGTAAPQGEVRVEEVRGLFLCCCLFRGKFLKRRPSNWIDQCARTAAV